MDKILLKEPWKLFLIFLTPAILAFTLTSMGIGEEKIQGRYNTHFNIIFGTLSFLLVFAWQYGMGLLFYVRSGVKSIGFKINGIIPVVLYLGLFLSSIFEFGVFLSKKEFYLNNPGKAVFMPVDLGIAGTIFKLLLIHSLITLFLNNAFIAKQIKKFEDKEIRKEYYFSFLVPMRKVTKWAIISVILMLGYVIVADISKLL